MLETLTRGFTSAREKLGGVRELTDENIEQSLRDVRTSLLEADVDRPVCLIGQRQTHRHRRIAAASIDIARSAVAGKSDRRDLYADVSQSTTAKEQQDGDDPHRHWHHIVIRSPG